MSWNGNTAEVYVSNARSTWDTTGKTLLILHELYPSKEALDAAGTGAADAMGETFEQLDELLVTLGASVGRS